MKLSNKTIQSLADALTPEVISYIHNDERYAEFMMELIPDAIQDAMGDLDDDLKMKLSFCVLERVCFKATV